MTKTAAQLDLDISQSLAAKPAKPAPTSITGWKKLVKEIKDRGWHTRGDEARAMLQRELDAAVDGLRAATKAAAHKPNFVTDTNLGALVDMVVKHGANAIPRRVEAVDAPHLKRCVQAGLLEPAGAAMRLTAAGREAVSDNLVSKIARKTAARQHDEVEKLERALANLTR